MREASSSRTVTDTDSYAFFVNQSNAYERMTAAKKYMAYIIPNIDPKPLDLESLPGQVIAFDISKSIKNYLSESQYRSLSTATIMSMTQRAWRLNPEHANNSKLIFACCKTSTGRRQIIGVFNFDRMMEDGNRLDKFVISPVDDDPHRHIFLARPAEEEVWNRYVGLFLPDIKQGERNPVKYYE